MSEFEFTPRGDNGRVGVERIEEPRFRAVCRFCPWRGAEHRHDDDAGKELEEHALSEAHREKVLFHLVAVHQGFDPLAWRLVDVPGNQEPPR